MQFRIRPVAGEDLGSIAELENENFSPWSLASLEKELMVEGGMQFIASSDAGVVAGWCAARIVVPDAELLKIAVADAFRRQKIGAGLLRHLIQQLSRNGVENLFLEVRSGNSPAVLFYKNFGFEQTGLRKLYYHEPDDAAILMALKLENLPLTPTNGVSTLAKT